jgi:hypothetical protein
MEALMSDKIEVYRAIAAVTGDLAKEGISKDRKNQQQGFQYRGIDDVYCALSSLLATHKLCILPRITHRDSEERTSAKGGVLFYNAITAEFDIVSAVDGSRHTVCAYGEAFDSGDKSIGKAMSYAYKAMAFMTFCIPTEGDNDPDAQTHEVKPQGQRQSTSSAEGTQSADIITPNQAKMLHAKMKATGADSAAFIEHFGIKEIELLPKSKMNDALKFIDGK